MTCSLSSAIAGILVDEMKIFLDNDRVANYLYRLDQSLRCLCEVFEREGALRDLSRGILHWRRRPFIASFVLRNPLKSDLEKDLGD